MSTLIKQLFNIKSLHIKLVLETDMLRKKRVKYVTNCSIHEVDTL